MITTPEDYTKYINSAEWQIKRAERLKIDDYTCRICKSKSNLHVHHITYDRLFDENISCDLITLCRACHERLHDQASRYKWQIDMNIEEFADRRDEIITPLQKEYVIKQSEIISNILCEYPDSVYSSCQTITKLIREILKVDWYNSNRLRYQQNNGGMVHTEALKRASVKRKARKKLAERGERG